MADEQIKDRFSHLGYFDQIPININFFLSTNEQKIFIYIKRCNKQFTAKYISWYEFAVNCAISKQSVFDGLLGLKKLKLITAKSQNNTGSLYALNSSEIENILETINSIKDIKERYVYGNQIRAKVNLKEINIAIIKLLSKHKHEDLTEAERGILIEEKVYNKIKYNKVNLNNSQNNNIQILLSRANEIQHLFSIKEIDLNEYNSRINEIKQATNNKIILDKMKNTWKTK